MTEKVTAAGLAAGLVAGPAGARALGGALRSKLFVPSSRPELFAKALQGEADALSFDLEDSVVEARKLSARESLTACLCDPATARSGKTLIVRVNAINTAHFEADVMAVVRPGLHLLNLPKPERIDDVLAAVQAIERAELANGVHEPVGLLLNIETPRALRTAAALASAHPRVAGLQMGLGDLFEPLGIARRDADIVRQVMLALRLAAGEAREAGVWACDGAFADISDLSGYRAEAEMARACGFIGKSCIHPSQVALANAVFCPTAAEITHALQVLQAARAAGSAGVGAFVVNGKMIDVPFVARAHTIIHMAQRLGLIPSEPIATTHAPQGAE